MSIYLGKWGTADLPCRITLINEPAPGMPYDAGPSEIPSDDLIAIGVSEHFVVVYSQHWNLRQIGLPGIAGMSLLRGTSDVGTSHGHWAFRHRNVDPGPKITPEEVLEYFL